MAADVFYNFTGETAFAQITTVSDPDWDGESGSTYGDTEYFQYSRDYLLGSVYKYRGSAIKVAPSFFNLIWRWADEDKDGFREMTDAQLRSENYKGHFRFGIRTGSNSMTYSGMTGRGSSTAIEQTVSTVGTYNYLVEAISSKYYEYYTVASGTFYVDKETGIKILSGNPSWVAAGGSISASSIKAQYTSQLGKINDSTTVKLSTKNNITSWSDSSLSTSLAVPSNASGTYTYYAYAQNPSGGVFKQQLSATVDSISGAKLVSDGFNGKTYTPGTTLTVGNSVTYHNVMRYAGENKTNQTAGVTIKFGSNAAASSVKLPTNVKGDYAYTLYKGSYSLGTGKIYMDYQTGIDKANATNSNVTSLSPGNKLSAGNISVKYTSAKSTLNHVVGKGGNTSLIKIIPESDYSTSLAWNDAKLVSEIEIPGGTSGNYQYRYVVKNEYTDELYASDPITVNVDSHEKVNVNNGNDENLSLGDSIYASSITASYEGTDIDENVNADDIYVIAASDWEGKEDRNNSGLVKEIKVPDDASGSFDYYVVIKDSTSAKGYWAAKYTVDCSENSTGFDETIWYSHTEDGIEWNYKLDKSGNIIGLYTTSSNLSKIVDEGGILNIPAVVNGRTVVKIGGGTESTPVIPSTAQGWTRLSLPSSVTTLNDFAFYQTGANAQITIPSSVTAIGIKAFYQSNIKGVKLSGMEGTVGSYAFGKTSNLKTISITGGDKGLEISSVSFADTGATDVTIKGNVTLNQKAFRGNTSLKSVAIDGNINVGPGAFSGDLSITSLNINGTVDVGEYAFDGLTSLAGLYLPEKVTLHSHSFEGLSSLTKLETETSLPALSFSNSGKVNTLILGEGVSSISYDWEGHTSSVSSRTVYIKNADTILEFYGKDGTYYSSMGSSGNVNVYVPSAQKDLGSSVSPDSNGVLKINGDTARAHGEYDLYEKGTAQSVVFNGTVNVSEQIKGDNVTSPKIDDDTKTQTGIEAYYNGTLLTTNPDGVKVTLDKDKMTVNRMYGSEEGDSYYADDFYVVKTSDYTKEAAKDGGLTESAIAAYPAVQATNDDLSKDSNVGSLAVTVVVFYDKADGERAYYTAPVSIRIERYTDKTYIEQKYGSYEEITKAFMEYEKQIKELQDLLANAGVDKIEELTQMLDEYKRAYAALAETLEEYVKNNNAGDNKYFGEVTKPDGTVVKVIYINGDPTQYEDTGKTDKDGNKIYKVSYDLDKDGTPETIYIVVKNDGVYIVDIDGNPVKDDNGKDIVFKDTINALKRQLAAQLASLKKELDSCDSGLKKIKDAMQDAGITINPSASLDDYTQIANGITDLKKRIEALGTSLSEAEQKVTDYSGAISTIYAKLMDDALTTKQAMSLQETLNAIINKIDVMKASNADLTNQVSNANSQISQLENQLKTTQDSLSKANADITAAEKDKADLQTQYEKAIAEGNAENAAKLKEQMDAKDAALAELKATKTSLEQKQKDIEEAQDTVKQLQKQLNDKNTEIEKLKKQIEQLSNDAEVYKTTLDNINSIFGLSLKQGDDVDKALRDYVAAVLADRKTISDIQKVVKSSSTGDALVSDVKAAIANGSGNTGNTDTTDEAVYKNGYNAGYKDGLKDGVAASGNNSGNSSADVNAAYNNGYNAGYAAGAANNSGNSGSIDTSYYDRQIESLNNRNSQLSDENSSLNERVSQLEDENSGLSDQIASLSDENSGLNSQIESLNGQVYALRNSQTATSTPSDEAAVEELETTDTTEESAVVTVSEDAAAEESLTGLPTSNLTDLTDSVPVSKVTFDSNLDNDADTTGMAEASVTATNEKHIKPAAAAAMGIMGAGSVGGLGYAAYYALSKSGNLPFRRKKIGELDDDIDVDVDVDDDMPSDDIDEYEEDDEDFDEFN